MAPLKFREESEPVQEPLLRFTDAHWCYEEPDIVKRVMNHNWRIKRWGEVHLHDNPELLEDK